MSARTCGVVAFCYLPNFPTPIVLIGSFPYGGRPWGLWRIPTCLRRASSLYGRFVLWQRFLSAPAVLVNSIVVPTEQSTHGKTRRLAVVNTRPPRRSAHPLAGHKRGNTRRRHRPRYILFACPPSDGGQIHCSASAPPTHSMSSQHHPARSAAIRRGSSCKRHFGHQSCPG